MEFKEPNIKLDPDWELGFLSRNQGSFSSAKCGAQVEADGFPASREDGLLRVLSKQDLPGHLQDFAGETCN